MLFRKKHGYVWNIFISLAFILSSCHPTSVRDEITVNLHQDVSTEAVPIENVIDTFYRGSPECFFTNSAMFDREPRGKFLIHAHGYMCKVDSSNMLSTLAEVAWHLGMERNGDLVQIDFDSLAVKGDDESKFSADYARAMSLENTPTYNVGISKVQSTPLPIKVEKGMIGFYNASVILTYLGVVSAVFGMSQAFNGNFKIAILCLMISGLTDMYDGTIAKMIKRSEDAKKFGIEIDSLCDLVCFGVYPVVIGYCLGMDQWYARIIYMCYVLGGVIRLAYFNVTEEQRQAHSSSRRKHYQGLPITSVALIIPIVYQLRRFFPEEFPYIYVAMLAVIAFLFVFDFKVFKPDKKCMLAFVVIGALIAVKMFLL